MAALPSFPSPGSGSSADSQGFFREKKSEEKISSGKEQSWCVTALLRNPLVAGISAGGMGPIQNPASKTATFPEPRVFPGSLFSLDLCFH